jgi:uncharacterized DUF497 family protein
VANINKHGVSLRAAEGFDWDTALSAKMIASIMKRCVFVAMGLINDRLHVLVFTDGSHENAVRAISLRQAEKHEVRFYYGQIWPGDT